MGQEGTWYALRQGQCDNPRTLLESQGPAKGIISEVRKWEHSETVGAYVWRQGMGRGPWYQLGPVSPCRKVKHMGCLSDANKCQKCGN